MIHAGLPPLGATVAVTGMNATDNPAPGVPVARALRHEPGFSGRVIGLGYDTLDPGFYAEGLLDGGAILPYPSTGREAYLARLLELHERFGFDVFIPTLDSELRIVAGLEPQLRHAGISTFLPSLEAIDRASKPRLARLGEDGGFRVPESEPIVSEDALPKLVQRFGLPLVIKGLYYGATVIHSEADAAPAFHYYAATWGVPVIVQGFVEGDEYNVCALGDGEGGLIGAVAMRKMALTDKGKGWAGITVDNPELLQVAEAAVRALRWRGPIEVEMLIPRGSTGAEPHVIEINPRFPAWVYLTAAAGQNLPYACALTALGVAFARPLPRPAAGKMFVRISMDQVADLATFAQLSATGMLGGGTESA